MHWIHALIGATVLVTIAFFVFFAGHRLENGGLRTFGRVLGGWLCLLAIAVIALAILHPHPMGFHGRHWMANPPAQTAPDNSSGGGMSSPAQPAPAPPASGSDSK